MQSELIDTNGDPVPDIVFEAFFKTNNENVVHIRVTGNQHNFTNLLSRFQSLCQQHQYSSKGISYGY